MSKMKTAVNLNISRVSSMCEVVKWKRVHGPAALLRGTRLFRGSENF